MIFFLNIRDQILSTLVSLFSTIRKRIIDSDLVTKQHLLNFKYVGSANAPLTTSPRHAEQVPTASYKTLLCQDYAMIRGLYLKIVCRNLVKTLSIMASKH